MYELVNHHKGKRNKTYMRACLHVSLISYPGTHTHTFLHHEIPGPSEESEDDTFTGS